MGLVKESFMPEEALKIFEEKGWYDEYTDINFRGLLEFFKKPFRRKGSKDADFRLYRLRLNYKDEQYEPNWTYLFDHLPVFLDCNYAMHLCHQYEDSYRVLATLSFNVKNGVPFVRQIQGVSPAVYKDSFVRDQLHPIYWTYLLLVLAADWAHKSKALELRVLPAEKNTHVEVQNDIARWESEQNPDLPTWWESLSASAPETHQHKRELEILFREYDQTALDLGFVPVKTSGGIPSVEYYTMQISSLEGRVKLHPQLEALGVICPDFDIKQLHRR